MNNTKKLLVLGGILVAIVVVILIVENLPQQAAGGAAEAKPFFPGFDKADCSAFVITDSDNTVRVFRTGDVWMVGAVESAESSEEQEPIPAMDQAVQEEEAGDLTVSYPADSSAVYTALEKLQNMKRDILISKNPKKQETFEVDSAHGILVEVFDRAGKSVGEFRVGKSGPDWRSHYVRSIGSDDVWAVSANIKHGFFTDLKRWRDKTILKFDTSTVKAVTIASRDTATRAVSTVRLEKALDTASNAEWTITKPEKAPAKPDVVSKLLDRLSKVKTSDWAEGDVDEETSGFGEPSLVATVEFENGDTSMLTVGKKQETGSRYYIRARGKEEVFLAYESAFGDFNKGFDDLKAE